MIDSPILILKPGVIGGSCTFFVLAAAVAAVYALLTMLGLAYNTPAIELVEEEEVQEWKL